MKQIKIITTLYYFIKYRKKIIIYRHSNIHMKKNSKIKVEEIIHVGKKWNPCDKQYTSLCIGENAILETKKLRIYDGGKITVKKGAILRIESGYLNSNVQINCKKRIQIGKDFACANGVVIRDNNAHSINNKIDYREITIGNHCWIGTNAIILPGAKLGNNCVVAAGSIVNKEFPSNCLIGGTPARILKTNIEWGAAVNEKI